MAILVYENSTQESSTQKTQHIVKKRKLNTKTQQSSTHSNNFG